jgi:phytoene synthase
MKNLFDIVSIRCSRLTTRTYSTSFSLGILCLDRWLRDPIYSIYGFVRFADEIVDSFDAYDKKTLFERFREDTYHAINEKISLNPILNSFQQAFHKYGMERSLVDLFLASMETDLSKKIHDNNSFNEYILGSAEVVGLMCLRVFSHGNENQYQQLKPYAMKLGAAFQKVNFLRDLNADYGQLGRTYFPGIDLEKFNEDNKRAIEEAIVSDFQESLQGIKLLPRTSRFGVYMAYVYYCALFKKIKNTPSKRMMRHRIRIKNRHKATLLAYSFIKHQLNLI